MALRLVGYTIGVGSLDCRRVSDSPESGLSGCSSCCSVLLVGFALRPVPQGGVESFLIVFQLDPGGNIPDGLASCGIHHLIDPLVLQGRIERLRPGIVPAHPGPARGSDDLISPQMLGELLGGVLAPPVRVEYRLPPVVYGRLRAAIPIASHTRGRCRVLSPQWRPRLLSSCSSPGTVARYTNPSQVRIYVISPTHFTPGWPAAGVPPDQVGTRAHGELGGRVVQRSFHRPGVRRVSAANRLRP